MDKGQQDSFALDTRFSSLKISDTAPYDFSNAISGTKISDPSEMIHCWLSMSLSPHEFPS